MGKNRALIAAHRGASGGNIPCNTLAAYEIALRQGADIVEIDVAISAEGGHYVFHPGMEFPHLRSEKLIRDMTDAEVASQRFVNQDGTPTAHKIATLDEVLDFLKGKCLINVDKFWTDIPGITGIIRAHGMSDQVIVKTNPDRSLFSQIAEHASDLPYMPVIRGEDPWAEELLANPAIRYIGSEILFEHDTEYFASDEYIALAHSRGLKLWVNSILYDYRVELAGGHSDDASLTGDPDTGWGWILDKGFDIIQTDWPLMLRQYMENR